MMSKPKFKNLGAVLDHLVDTHNLRSRLDEQRALDYWPMAVGREISGVTHPRAIRNGILYIETKSSSWRQELTYKKDSIIQKLNHHLESSVVKNIVFK